MTRNFQRERRAWASMKARCLNPNVGVYRYYGGRGVRVHPRWVASFDQFLQDVGPIPSTVHSLDRIDVNGDYAPGNVRWATRLEQARNKRNTVRLTWGGETLRLDEWALRLGISADAMRIRYHRCTRLENIFAKQPKKTSPRNSAVLTHGGVTRTLSEWAAVTGIGYTTLLSRQKRGLTAAEILEPPPPRSRSRGSITHDGLSLTLIGWARRTGLNRGTIAARLRAGWSLPDALGTPNHHTTAP